MVSYVWIGSGGQGSSCCVEFRLDKEVVDLHGGVGFVLFRYGMSVKVCSGYGMVRRVRVCKVTVRRFRHVWV